MPGPHLIRESQIRYERTGCSHHWHDSIARPARVSFVTRLVPQNQFQPSEPLVQRIFDNYGIRLNHFEEATSGIENVTLIAYTDGGKYVLRVYRQNKKSDDEILRELDFMRVMREQRLPVPHVVPSTHGLYLEVVNLEGRPWQCIVMDYVRGTHPKTYTPVLVNEMADLQATMHRVGQSYMRQHDIPTQRRTLREVYITDRLLADASLGAGIRAFLTRVRAFAVDLDDALPRGLSHFDYDVENVLADESGHLTAILDFDDVKCLPVVVCLAYTLHDILDSATDSEELAKRYLRRYQQTRLLTAGEKNILPQIILFRHYVCAIFDLDLHDSGEVDLNIRRYVSLVHSAR